MNLQTPTKKTVQTPVKAIQFGSPNALKKPVPHIVFLITSKDQNIKLAITRILLYFYFHVTPTFTWGYQIIKDQVLQGQRLPVSNQMLTLSGDSLYQFEQDWKNTAIENVNLNQIVSFIRQIKIQAAWNNGPVALFQSPLKRPDTVWNGWKGTIKIRNYLFVLGKVPRDADQLNRLCNTTNLDIKNALFTFNHKLLSCDVWMDLMKERIGLSWIDTSTDPITTDTCVIESWFSAVLKTMGGMIITKDQIQSTDFVSILKQFLPSQIDASACKLIVGPNATRNSFCDSFESNYFSSWSIRSRKGFLATIQSLDSQNRFFVNMLSKTDLLDATQMEEYQSIEIVGYFPNFECDSIKQFSCLPCSKADGMLDFAKEFYHLKKTGSVLVCKTRNLYGVIEPLMPNMATFKVISNEKYKEIQNDIKTETLVDLIELNEWNTDVWFSGPNFPKYLSTFIQTGKVLPSYSKKLVESLLDIWSLSEARFLTSPVKKKPKMVTEKQDVLVQEKKLVIETFTSLDHLFRSFEHFYQSVLFDKYSLLQFLQTIVPNIYGQLVNLVPEEDDPTPVLVDFYSSKLLLSMPKLDEKYAKIDQQLAFLLDNTPTALDQPTQSLATSWFLKKKQASSLKNLTVDPRNVLKKSARELKIKEYCLLIRSQLQLILWLECLRIEKETKLPLPIICLDKSKKKKLKMAEHFQKCIHLMVDKLMIWTMTGDAESLLWSSFIEPIIKGFYHESLPHIVEPILTKLQPVEKPIEPESEIILQPSSPLPKKKRSKTKIQRAPSLMEQMTKRQVATISKSKSAKSKRKESLRSEEEQRLTLDDFLAQSKENIHVPETPQKNIGFFDSPSEFKSPTKRRYAKPEFTTPTKKSKFSNVILQTPE